MYFFYEKMHIRWGISEIVLELICLEREDMNSNSLLSVVYI